MYVCICVCVCVCVCVYIYIYLSLIIYIYIYIYIYRHDGLSCRSRSMRPERFIWRCGPLNYRLRCFVYCGLQPGILYGLADNIRMAYQCGTKAFSINKCNLTKELLHWSIMSTVVKKAWILCMTYIYIYIYIYIYSHPQTDLFRSIRIQQCG